MKRRSPNRCARSLASDSSCAGKYDGGSVDPAGGPGSHLVAGLAGANALIVLDEECASAEVGDRVPVLVLDENF